MRYSVGQRDIWYLKHSAKRLECQKVYRYCLSSQKKRMCLFSHLSMPLHGQSLILEDNTLHHHYTKFMNIGQKTEHIARRMQEKKRVVYKYIYIHIYIYTSSQNKYKTTNRPVFFAQTLVLLVPMISNSKHNAIRLKNPANHSCETRDRKPIPSLKIPACCFLEKSVGI